MTISKLRTGKVAAVQNFLCIVFVLIASAFAAGQAQADPISVSPEVLPPGKVGVAYDQTYVVSGGLSGGPYFSTFSGASDRIPGLCCFANNEFRISGVPKAAGTYVLRYLFGERAWLDEVPGASPPVPKIYTVVIAEPDPVEITLAGLPDGQAGQPYSAQLTASGGDGAYSFSIVSGAIPIGMSFSAAGAIGGTPIQSGSFTVRFRATDSGGRSGDRSYTFEIAPPPPVVVAPAILPDGQLGQPYNHTLTASGGVRGPYQFSIVSGNLPVGTFSSAGVMSGTALVAGIYNFRIRATDDVGYTGERDYKVVISDGPPVTIAPATLPDGKVGQFYDETMVASGGAGGPYSITLVGIPVMPPGLAYAGGRLSGTATVAGTYSFTVRAVDRAGNFTERDYSIVIADTPVTLSPTALPDGQVGQPYDQTVVASGGAGGPYSITLVGIPVTPPGLAYADGRFSGTATVAGTYPFTLRATDRGGNFIERQYSIVISSTPPVTLSPTTITAGQIGQPYSQTFTASGGIGAPYRYFVVVGNLPDGIDMALDGTLAGTPTQSGSFPFTVDVFDAADNRGSRQYTLVIDALPPPTAPSLTASVVAGETVTLPLTQGATGGPFSDAAILSSTPTEAGTATLSGAPAYALTFASSSAFSGTAIVTYTLTGPGGVSAPATVTITVAPRPDPSDDPEVAGLLNAQAQAAQQFAAGQIDNINQRMGALRGETCRDTFANAVRLSGAGEDGRPGSVVLPDKTGCDNAAMTGGVGFWAGGYVDFGYKSPDDGTTRDSISVDVTAGFDYRFNNQFVAGLGIGYASDESDIGVNGTKSSGEAYSVTLYASYRPTEWLFVDALAGYGDFSFDSRRFVTGTGGFANGQRDGDQVFGSITTGFDYSTGSLQLTPFARLAASSSTLDAFTESGAGIYSLAYGEQSVDSLDGTIGLTGSYEIPVAIGLLVPRFRFEYTHEFSGSSDVDIILYADLPGGPAYGFQTTPFARDQVMIGLGADLRLHNQMTIGFDYRGTIGFEDSHSHAFGLKLNSRF